MNLVIIQNRQAVTTSLQVAETFEKRHDNVLREIEGLLKIEEAQKYFQEGTYEHPQNKQQYRMFYMNRDGFTLLAMGFTGSKALDFKLKYIQAFNEMEHSIEKQLSQDPITLALESALETRKQVQGIQTAVVEVKETVQVLFDTMRIDGRQEYALKSQGKAKVLEVLGGYDSPAYTAISKKVFAKMWGDFKRHFILPRSTELPKARFEEGVKFISMWRPDTSMAMDIEAHNKQTHLKLVQ